MARIGEDPGHNQRPSRPSPSGDAVDAAPKDVGLVCRKCSCRHFYVVWVMPQKDGSIHRCKACRNCGLRVRTREKPVV